MPKLSYYSLATVLVIAVILHVGQLAFTISTHSKVIQNGQEIMLPVRVRDPIDRYRGNYLRLHLSWLLNEESEGDYLIINADEDGEVFYMYYAEEPEEGLLYIKDFDIASFYMRESLAKEVEKSQEQLYLSVRVYKGEYTITDLYVGRNKVG